SERDQSADRQGPASRLHAHPARPALQQGTDQARDRTRARQEAVRQARRDQGTRMESREAKVASRSARHGPPAAFEAMKLPLAIELREAGESDFTAIAAIYAEHVRTGTATFEIEPPDAVEMARRWREATRARLPYLVAVAGGEIVAYAYAG